MSDATYSEGELRERAVVRLKKRAQFRSHLITYALVNLWHVVIWAVIWALTGFSFFWPIFPAAGWGVFLALNWWDVFRRKDKPPKAEGPTEAQVRQEMDALRLKGPRST
jgi:2TM domain